MGCGPSAPPKPPAPKYNLPPQAAMHRNPPQPGVYSQYHEQARAAFTQGDTNQDGVLDAQELYGVLMRLGFFNGVPPHQINQIMETELQKADRHQVDRRITFDEFVPYFEYLMQELQRRGAVMRAPAQPTQYYGQPGYGVNYGQPQYAQAPPPPYGGQQQQMMGGGGYGGHPQQQMGGRPPMQQHGGRGGGGGGYGMGAMAGAAVGGAVVGGVIGANHEAIGGGIAGGANAVAGWAPGAMDTAGGWAQAGYYVDGAGYAVDGANAVAGWAPGAMDTAGGGAAVPS